MGGNFTPLKKRASPPKEKVEIIGDLRALGDQLCAISAMRELARQSPRLSFVTRILPEVVDSYRDGLVTVGDAEKKILLHPWDDKGRNRHRAKNDSPDCNYVGTYWSTLGLRVTPPGPSVELPRLDFNEDALEPFSYGVLQPFAGWAANFPASILHQFVRRVPKKIPVLVVGSPETPMTVTGATYCLGGPLRMLRLIRHAKFVLTPRSAAAHIAAGYNRPAVVWSPNDGEEWHLNYPNWSSRRVVLMTAGSRAVLKSVGELLEGLQ